MTGEGKKPRITERFVSTLVRIDEHRERLTRRETMSIIMRKDA